MSVKAKSPLKSKTLWLNVAALVVALVQHYSGTLPAVDGDVYNMAVVVMNLILRAVTKAPLAMKP